jgi:hypothetical protein
VKHGPRLPRAQLYEIDAAREGAVKNPFQRRCVADQVQAGAGELFVTEHPAKVCQHGRAWIGRRSSSSAVG